MEKPEKKLNEWIKIKSLPNPLREAYKTLIDFELAFAEKLAGIEVEKPELKEEYQNGKKMLLRFGEVNSLIIHGSFLLDMYREEHASVLWQLNEAKKRLGIPKDEKITNQKQTKK